MNNPTILVLPDCNLTPETLSLLKTKFVVSDNNQEGSILDAVWLPYGQSYNALGQHWVVSNTTSRPLTCGTQQAIYLDDPIELLEITPTAEHTLLLMMAADRSFRRVVQHVGHGHWDRYQLPTPKMLSDCLLTIVGGDGRVGKHLRFMAQNVFRCVWYIEEEDSLGSIEESLAKTDFLAITASSNESPIIGYEELKMMPKGGVVVNTSRGKNLCYKGLLRSLREEHTRAAALDVITNDHDIRNNPEYDCLWTYHQNNNNLILTPHIAGSTEDAWNYTQQLTVKKLFSALDKKGQS